MDVSRTGVNGCPAGRRQAETEASEGIRARDIQLAKLFPRSSPWVCGRHVSQLDQQALRRSGRRVGVGFTASDIARVVVGILADPSLHLGERYVVTGPRNMTIAEMAEVLTHELGRPIEYVDLGIEHWGRALAERGDLSEFLVTHLTWRF